MDWIENNPENNIENLAPKYKYVLFFDRRDYQQKRGRLLHGLWEYGYLYELEGKEFQDKEHDLTHWKELGSIPEYYEKIRQEEQSKRDKEFFNDLFK